MSTHLTSMIRHGNLVAQASFEGPDVGWVALSPLIVLVGAALGL